jgi:hypothetical protein
METQGRPIVVLSVVGAGITQEARLMTSPSARVLGVGVLRHGQQNPLLRKLDKQPLEERDPGSRTEAAQVYGVAFIVFLSDHSQAKAAGSNQDQTDPKSHL